MALLVSKVSDPWPRSWLLHITYNYTLGLRVLKCDDFEEKKYAKKSQEGIYCTVYESCVLYVHYHYFGCGTLLWHEWEIMTAVEMDMLRSV